jgi:hypothetical protein
MATRVFSEAELDQLRRFPESIAKDELVRYFTLMPGEVAFVNAHRRPANKIGIALQLCTLPWLGFVPDELTAAPAAAVARLSEKLLVPVGELRSYGAREQTRTDHTCARSPTSSAGGPGTRGCSTSWPSSCWPGRWSTTPPACCSAWPVSTCAAPA